MALSVSRVVSFDSALRWRGSDIPTSVFSGSDVSLVGYDDGMLLLSVVLVCSYFSYSSSTTTEVFRGPVVTFDKIHVS